MDRLRDGRGWSQVKSFATLDAADAGRRFVHIAELWDPGTGTSTQLAAEQVDRCYHATALLLAVVPEAD